MPDSNLQLDTLEAKGLIRLAAFQPELEYLFRHALVQDTAYESLLKQERRALHKLVGDALEDLYPERHADLAAILAMHFEQAGDTERAVTYLMAAARFAFDRNAIVEAFDLYSRADKLLPPATESDSKELLRQRVEIGLGQARAGFAFLDRASQIEILERTVGYAERLGDLRLIADAHLYNALQRQFEGERAETSPQVKRSLDRVSQIADELKDPLIAALPKSVVGLSQVFSGEIREGIAKLEETAPLLAQKRDFVGSSFALMALGVGYARLGEFAKADAAVEHAKEIAEGGDIIARIDTMIGEAMIANARGDLDSAVPLAQKCSQMAEDAGATACVVGSNVILGESLMRQGQFGGAKIAFDRGSEVAEVTNQRMFKPALAAFRRSVAASMGEYIMNGRTFEEALDDAREMRDKWTEAHIYWRRAEADRVKPEPDREQILSDYATAEDQLEQMGARPSSARVLRDWGKALRAFGMADEAEEKLRRSLALFDELGIGREANEVKGELTAA